MQQQNSVDALKEAEKKVLAIAKEIVAVKTHLEATKFLYEKLDKLTFKLKEGLEALGLKEVLVQEQVVDEKNGPILVPPKYVSVVDNFEDKNVIFKPVSVRRWEAVAESEAERDAKKLLNKKSIHQ